MKMTCLLVLAFLLCSGCIADKSINIQSAKSWENHYMTTDEFKKGTSQLTLDKGESVWVLSNTTLKRVLKNVEK